MSLARDIADLGSVTARLDTVGAASGSFGVGRNVIVNSAMMVSQRGTSFASVGNVYTLDRFLFYKQNSGAAFTVTQSSVTDLAGFANALKVDCTTADTSLASNEEGYIQHKIEGQDLQRFQKGHATALGFTLSFYVKTNKTGVYTVKIFDRDNSRDVSGSYTVADTNWNRYTINFPADTTGKFDDDNASSLEIFFKLFAGSDTTGGTLNTAWRANADTSAASGQVNFADSTSNDWEITGIQLETGSGAATDFEHRSFGDELLRCKRYFEVYSPTASDNGSIGVIRTRTSTNSYQGLVNFLEKRTQPTCTIDFTIIHKPGVSKESISSISVSLSSGETQSCTINVTPSSDSTISTYGFLGVNSGTGSLKIDAEL